ncbi:unnamed protein product [Cylindrotheca closterium]|uniref:Uncharacterized protein n=1 Tax=Cylindrotheca closterium TaxID=2856 RepID=A0AAD2JNW8_9STRA|nr:unnamed protein product [Cylindrotheca closterium]
MMFSTLAVALLASSAAVSEAAAAIGLRGQANTASVPTLPNGISCRFCPDDDNYKYPLDDDWTHWHRGLDEKANSRANTERELTSTDKLKATAKVAHYEAHFLEHAASKQSKDEHKRALQAAAVEADKEASMLVDAVNGGDADAHDRILKEKMLPNDISCRFCPDDDNYKYPLDDDWTHWHRNLDAKADSQAADAERELTSTDKLKATAKAAHYEAHFLQHAASKQAKDEHKRALQDAAVEANKEASMLIDAVKSGDVNAHDRILKEKLLPNDISCRFCPDDDNYKYPLDDDWTHWHRDLKDVGESSPVEADEGRKMKEVKLPNGISCRFCPDDDNYKYPLDDDWTHWH